MSAKQSEVDDLVSLLDSLMEQGSGHVTLRTEEGKPTDVKTYRSSDCAAGDCACRVPTPNLD